MVTASCWSCRRRRSRGGLWNWLHGSARCWMMPWWTTWRPSTTLSCSKTRQVAPGVPPFPPSSEGPCFGVEVKPNAHKPSALQLRSSTVSCTASSLCRRAEATVASRRAGSGERRALLCCGSAPFGSVRVARLGLGLQASTLEGIAMPVSPAPDPELDSKPNLSCFATFGAFIMEVQSNLTKLSRD